MINIIITTLLIIFLYFFVRYSKEKIQKLGFIFTLVVILKWFVGIIITFFAFYVIYLAGNYMKGLGLSVVFSLPVGVISWFVPMHYVSKFFEFLEKKYKKEPSLESS